MNDELIELCAEAKRRQTKAFAASGQAQHQGFYIGEVLAEKLADHTATLKLIAQVIRDYKAVPDVLAEIADGLEK